MTNVLPLSEFDITMSCPCSNFSTYPAFVCSKLATETLEQSVKCSKLTIKTPGRRH